MAANPVLAVAEASALQSESSRKSGRGVLLAGRPGIRWALPGLVFFTLFALVPMGAVVLLSFVKWNGIASPTWIGFQNWQELFGDTAVLNSIVVTVVLLVGNIVVQLPLAIVLGAWAAGVQRNRAILSAIYFLPLLLSGAATAVVWRQLMDPNFGVPAQLKVIFGGSGNFVGTPHGAIILLILVGTWSFVPFHTLIYQAAVRGIPEQLYQAASIDGAGRYRQFFSITLPQLKNTIVMSLIFMVIGNMTAFELILILTQGGPGHATTTMPLIMYFEAFRYNDLGYGAAIATVLIVFATGVSIVIARVTGFDRMQSTQEGL